MAAVEEQLVPVAVARSMSADFTSAALEMAGFDCGGIQFTWTGADATTARVIPQVSIDGENYCDYIAESGSKKVDGTDGCGMYELQKICFRFMRVRFLHKTNTTGTITVYCYAKRLRYYA